MATAAPHPINLFAAEEEQLQALQTMLQRHGTALLVTKAGREDAVEIPQTVHELLLLILEEMRHGNAISVVPINQDLTTQQAAELIGISRPFFVKLLETGKLPFHLA